MASTGVDQAHALARRPRGPGSGCGGYSRAAWGGSASRSSPTPRRGVATNRLRRRGSARVVPRGRPPCRRTLIRAGTVVCTRPDSRVATAGRQRRRPAATAAGSEEWKDRSPVVKFNAACLAAELGRAPVEDWPAKARIDLTSGLDPHRGVREVRTRAIPPSVRRDLPDTGLLPVAAPRSPPPPSRRSLGRHAAMAEQPHTRPPPPSPRQRARAAWAP